MQVPRVSKLLSEFSIYHFFDSPAHHFSCRPQIYPPLWGVCRANGSPTFTTFGNQVRELLPSVRMKQRGQYLLLARRLRTVQNICSGHSILFSIIHLSCWKYCTTQNIYYYLNFLFFVFNRISKGYIYNVFEWKQFLFKFNKMLLHLDYGVKTF